MTTTAPERALASPQRAASDTRIGARDLRILAAARARLRARASFLVALEALREAVEEEIPGGRIFHLGAGPVGPVFGSRITGVGITPGESGALVVRVKRGGELEALGALER